MISILIQISYHNPGNGKVNSMAQLEKDVMDLLSSQKSINTTSKLRHSSKFFDVLIKLDDGTLFEAHKFLLAKHSPFFLKLFTYENTHEYHLGNVSVESFTNILDWIYKVKWLMDTLPKKPRALLLSLHSISNSPKSYLVACSIFPIFPCFYIMAVALNV